MKKQIFALVAMILAAGFVLVGCGAQTTKDEASQTVPRPEAFEPAAVLEYLCSTAFAGRQNGTDGCVEAGEYVAGFLNEWGYQPLFGDSLAVPYTAVVGDPALAESEIILHLPDGDITLTEGVDYTFSFHTEDIDVTLPLSEAGEDCAGGKTVHLVAVGSSRGKSPIVLRERDVLDASSDVREERIIELSPSAFVLAKQAEQVTLRIKASAGELERNNYCAVLPGADRTQAMVLCAHIDGTGTWGEVLYPSAHDNASGTVALLECARQMAGDSPPYDLVFCIFTGEEQSLLGSEALAPVLEEHYDLINVINLDCLGCGVADSLKLLGKDTALGEALWPYLQQAGYTSYQNYNAASDQDSFTHPAVGLCELPQGYRFHQADDTVDTVDPLWLQKIADAVCAYVRQAQVEKWEAAPSPQQPSASTEDPYAGVMNGMQREALRRQLTQGLAYDQGIGGTADYVIDQGAGPQRTAMNVLYTAWGMLTSTQEVLQYYPRLELPETIGDAEFFGAYVVHNMGAIRVSRRPKWEDDQQYTIDWNDILVEELILYYCREDGSGYRLYTDGSSAGASGLFFLGTGEQSHGFRYVLEDGREIQLWTISGITELEGLQETGIYWNSSIQLNDKAVLQAAADLIQPEVEVLLDWVTFHQQ